MTPEGWIEDTVCKDVQIWRLRDILPILNAYTGVRNSLS